MIEDLTMLATLPVCDDETAEKARAEADKAAAAETMPPPKDRDATTDDTNSERVARRGQDPSQPEEPGDAITREAPVAR